MIIHVHVMYNSIQGRQCTMGYKITSEEPLSFPVDCNISDKIEKWFLFYLQEKDLIHKLFKVLLPRYRGTSTYTQMYMLPPDVPGFGKDMAVLELKGQFEMVGINTVVRDIA